jgi:hypothetical protein
MIASVPVKRVASRQGISAAAVYLTSDDADYIHATALHMTAGRLASDRRALSRSRTGLSWRTHIRASFAAS